MSWQVFVTMSGIPDRPDGRVRAEPEIRHDYPSWPQARHEALQWTCLNGTRYVSVQAPDGVAVAEYDRYTNRWRQYPRALVGVEHTTEVAETYGHAAVGAWCSCGWSRLAFYAWHIPETKDKAHAAAIELAAAHKRNPGEV